MAMKEWAFDGVLLSSLTDMNGMDSSVFSNDMD